MADDVAAIRAELEAAKARTAVLQSQLSAARRSGADSTAIQSELSGIRSLVATLAAAVASGETVSEEVREALTRMQQQTEAAAAQGRVSAYYRTLYDEAVEAAGLSVEDERLGAAREAMNAGKFADAIKLVTRVGAEAARQSAKLDEKQVESAVAARVEEALKQLGVRRADLGASTVSSPAGLTVEDLRKAAPRAGASVRDLLKVQQDLKDRFFKG